MRSDKVGGLWIELELEFQHFVYIKYDVFLLLRLDIG